MVTVTFTPSEAVIESAVRTVAKVQGTAVSYSRFQRAMRYLAPRFIKWLFPLLAIYPTIVICSTHSSVSGWMAVYLIIVSWLGGRIAHLTDRDDLRPLMSAMLGGMGPILVRLTENGLETEAGETKSLTPWTAITKVLLTDDLVLILMQSSSFYVPFSAFTTKEEMHDFAKFAASMISNDR